MALPVLGCRGRRCAPGWLTMLNIVTVHWKSAKWVDPQLRYLEENLDTPFRVFAALNGIEDPAIWKRFHLAEDLEGTHAEKLNTLGRIAVAQSDPSDRLLFLDGDAFPVRPIGEWTARLLEPVPLAAVRRDENLGDCQPHPCFCITTCGFWAAIDGDWREGGSWTNSVGEETTDVGGTLLHQLSDRGVEWQPLLRTNTSNPNPLWFGVYEHRVYHHGAGFRPRISRVEYHAETEARQKAASAQKGPSIEGLAVQALRRPSLLASVRPRHVANLGPAVAASAARRKRLHVERRQFKKLQRAEEFERGVFDRLRVDPQFYRQFDDAPEPDR